MIPEAEASPVFSTPQYIVIHHTGIALDAHTNQLQSVNDSHKRKGYPLSKYGYNIAYHHFIGSDGTTVRTRSHDDISVHTKCGYGHGNDKCKNGYKDINDNSIAVVLAGDFEHIDHLKGKQLAALRATVTALQKRYNIPRQNVLTHKHVSPTVCAGKNLIKDLWNE